MYLLQNAVCHLLHRDIRIHPDVGGGQIPAVPFLIQGGQCRRVVYTPGQSTWAAMRYTGEYQIQRSKEDEKSIVVCLPGSFLAFPGDIVELRMERMGLSGTFRVAESENEFSIQKGATATLTLKERM